MVSILCSIQIQQQLSKNNFKETGNTAFQCFFECKNKKSRTRYASLNSNYDQCQNCDGRGLALLITKFNLLLPYSVTCLWFLAVIFRKLAAVVNVLTNNNAICLINLLKTLQASDVFIVMKISMRRELMWFRKFHGFYSFAV